MDVRVVRIAALIALALSCPGCNALGAIGTPADECSGWQEYDEAVGSCVVARDALACTPATEFTDCGVGQVCDANVGFCVDDAYVIYVYEGLTFSPRIKRLNSLHVFMAERVARTLESLGALSRPVRVEKLEVDQTNTETIAATFAPALRPNVLAVLGYGSTTSSEVQELLRGSRIVSVNQFSNTKEFEADAQSWERFAFGLIPSPRPDLASWSRFLSEHDGLLSPRTGLGPCRKLGYVFQDSASAAFTTELSVQLLPSYPGMSLPALIPFEGSLQASIDGIYTSLRDQEVDCVFMRDLDTTETLNEYADLILQHEEWRATQGGAPIRWVLINRSRFPSIKQEALERGQTDALEGTLMANYDVGGELKELLFDEVERDYTARVDAECPEGGSLDGCDWFSLDELATTYKERLTVCEDMATLALLAAARAERRADGPVIPRRLVRDSVVALLSASTEHEACDRSPLRSCVTGLDEGAEVHYFGASSDMLLGDDGRVSTYDEEMIFSEVVDGEPVERLRYTHKEMVENYRRTLGLGGDQ